MKATEARLLQFLKKAPQFIIPIYQRTYSWAEKECAQLWDDIVRAGCDDKVSVHFIGSIVYIEAGLSQVTNWSSLVVIDGQQRLTSLTLLLAALEDTLGEAEPVDGFSARKIQNYFLVNPEESGERKFKLLLSQTDRASLTAIVGGTEQPKEQSVRVTENYKFFRSRMEEHKDRLAEVCKGVAKLMVVDIALTRDQDNPQLIFESMNSTGRELSQADLIRNFILMGLKPEVQAHLYDQYWRPMEVEFGQEAYGQYFDDFMRHYLTVKTGDIPNIRDVYDAFKLHARPAMVTDAGTENLVKDIRDGARAFCAMALGRETDAELKLAFEDLRELKVDVAYPFLLELYADYKKDILPRAEFVEAVRLVEAYVFRRTICAIPTNSTNKTFATFGKALVKDRYLESVHAHFLQLPSYRRFPKDDEFVRDLQTRDLYKSRKATYWLRRLENHDRKERVPVHEFSVEHILPQSENLSAAWKTALGPEWERVRDQWLHTAGNLTLTGYNSEYSDRPFAEKRDMEMGFKSSPLRLNFALGKLEHWNEDAIKARAIELAETAKNIWAAPQLSAGALSSFTGKSHAPVEFTIESHAQLKSGAMRELFEAFRKEVLALDPCVTEEFKKLYVAFKAETNFVDVIPQAKRLRLTLNLTFPEINDPKGLCEDVTNLGRWGNGDVQVSLNNLSELPYVMDLVRQSIDSQMSAG